MQSYQIVLASSSPYRKLLLEKLPIDFITASPDIDESPHENEPPAQLALRLALAKASALQSQYSQHLIIASDQVAVLDKLQLTKPSERNRAIQQLLACSGRNVDFYTSICLLETRTGQHYTDIDKTTVYFKTLSLEQIEHYVDVDQPFNCAGGFKVEALGIALFERIESEDPNALIGLPMIKLINLLGRFGIDLL